MFLVNKLRTWAPAFALAIGALGSAPAVAVDCGGVDGVDCDVKFGQAGRVDIQLLGNAGGFDHILEPVLVAGNGLFSAGVPTGPAWIVGTEGGSLLNLVGDPSAPRSPTAFNTDWGFFDVVAGQEITFRLTNVLSGRIGGTDPDELGTIASQLFSGSSAGLNTNFAGGSVLGGSPGSPSSALSTGYTFVDFVSATEIRLRFEDLDPARLPIEDRWQNMEVRLVLTPVPEPSAVILAVAGIGLLGGVARRRRQLARPTA